MMFMKKVGEITRCKEGSKTVFKVQFPKGILTFKTLKVAKAWQEMLTAKNVQV